MEETPQDEIFDFPRTCPELNDIIRDFKVQYLAMLVMLLDEVDKSGYKDGISIAVRDKMSTEFMYKTYPAFRTFFERTRLLNMDMRTAANKQLMKTLTTKTESNNEI